MPQGEGTEKDTEVPHEESKSSEEPLSTEAVLSNGSAPNPENLTVSVNDQDHNTSENANIELKVIRLTSSSFSFCMSMRPCFLWWFSGKSPLKIVILMPNNQTASLQPNDLASVVGNETTVTTEESASKGENITQNVEGADQTSPVESESKGESTEGQETDAVEIRDAEWPDDSELSRYMK